ncbi:hypothetical protein [Thalassospira alkalitolerans]|mgnify:CR=1 FL=1|uniref:Uncharacterized protein n=1 Tax=Thalassospira alkalitolerans TaxID=1293890 RepID=A0A1Y2L5P9_9PROT|nr:hypothetical protein [Thalassospira alkalitolerans]OSQ42781.1 hypothetical protein TALK_21235 [Thalassospira alkalitolerans]
MARTRHSFGPHQAFGIGRIHSGTQKSTSNRSMVEAGHFGIAQTTRVFDATAPETASRDMASVFYG